MQKCLIDPLLVQPTFPDYQVVYLPHKREIILKTLIVVTSLHPKRLYVKRVITRVERGKKPIHNQTGMNQTYTLKGKIHNTNNTLWTMNTWIETSSV